jgi:hypothetical protein
MDGTDKTGQVINFSASAGTFQLPAAHYTVGKDVTFTGQGYVDGSSIVIENPLDIILDIMANYLNIAYTSTTFNTTEWDATTLLVNNIGLAVQKRTAEIEVLRNISGKTGIGFLLERDGRYTARKYNADANPVLTVYQHQWIGEPDIKASTEEVLTSATVKYNKSLNKDTWQSVTDDSQEGMINSKFDLYRDYEGDGFESLFVTEDDALEHAQEIMSKSNDVEITITGILKDSYVDLTQVKVGLNAQIEVNRLTKGVYSEWLGKMKCEILEVDPDFQNRTVKIKFRRIEDLESFKLGRFRITRNNTYRITRNNNFRTTRPHYE